MTKRVRINTSLVVLEDDIVTVFRKGEIHKVIQAKDVLALSIFERECMLELNKAIHK